MRRIPISKDSIILFYPISFSNKMVNGLGIGDSITSQSSVVSLAKFYILRFFTPEIFFFQLESKELDLFEKNNEYMTNSFVFVNSEFSELKILNSRKYSQEITDEYTGEPNPLKHLICKSEGIDQRGEKCLFLAMDYGFPMSDIVDFSQKTVLKHRDEILRKWEAMIESQHGNLEKDFVKTLRKNIRKIKNEYSNLFNEMAKITKKDILPVSKPIFDFLETLQEEGILADIPPPRIFFDLISVKAIFDLKEGFSSEYSKSLLIEFKDRGYRVNVRHNVIDRSRKKERQRMRFSINLTFPENVDMTYIKWELRKVKDIIISKLKETDPEAYRIFSKRRLEIWLKRIKVHVIVHESFEEEAIFLMKKYFRGILDHRSIVSQDHHHNLVEISFRLSFDRMTDYLLSETNISNVAPDRYTRLGVEEMYRGKFTQAMRYLKKAKYGLLGDLYTIKSKEAESESRSEYLRKSSHYYKRAKIQKSKRYLDSQNKGEISRALEINSDWMISLRLFLEARKEEKRDREKAYWELLLKRYSGLNLDKNLRDFTEEMGNFYTLLLGNLQRKYGLSPQEMLGLGF